MADDRLLVLTVELWMDRKVLPEIRLHAEHREQIFRRLDRVDADRLAAVIGEIDLRTPPGGDVGEDARETAIVDEVHGRDRLMLERLRVIDLPQRDESIGLRVWEWSQHDAAEETEHAG